MKRLLIKKSLVIDPKQSLNKVCDILIENKKIKDIGENIFCDDCLVIDGTGLITVPGFIDLHTHFRDPGFLEKEDILSGSCAAVAGGITTACVMPNTSPSIDSVEVIRYIKDKAKYSRCEIVPIAAITKGLNGQELTDFDALIKAGAQAFSDDGVPVRTSFLMKKALEKSAEYNVPLFAHCEDKCLTNGGIINEGYVSAALNVKGISEASENIGTLREIGLLMSAPKSAKLHICHVSTENSAYMIQKVKERGFNLTAETCPHYFAFTEKMLLSRDADFRMSPPLRTEKDRLAIIDYIKNDTIDVISTDHAPHTEKEKSEFENAPNGVVGCETSFAASNTYLVKQNHLTLEKLIYKMSTKPAKILGRTDIGNLEIGTSADIVMLNPKLKWIVDVNKLHGKSKNCIFKNTELIGRVVKTIYKGNIVFEI
ncbi:MAG: dihydroorotase [Candidatus Fimenecus sp.]